MTSAQDSFFVRDSSRTVGAAIVNGTDRSNGRVCKVKNGKKITEFTPWQVKEYGFKDGGTFIARDLPLPDSVQRVFLEQLSHGKCTVYYYWGDHGKLFYLAKDPVTLTELPKRRSDGKNFRKDLAGIMADCPQMSDAIRVVRYSREGYKKLLDRYEKCEKKPFPFFKWGITAGYSAASMIFKPTLQALDFTLESSYDGGMVTGFFLDMPIRLSDFSLCAEVLYSPHQFSETIIQESSKDNKKIEFHSKVLSLQFPILFRYSFPVNTVRPFVNAGGVLLLNFISEEWAILTYSKSTGPDMLDLLGGSIIEHPVAGYLLGAGFSARIFPRNWISLEARYNGFTPLRYAAQKVNVSEFQVLARFSF